MLPFDFIHNLYWREPLWLLISLQPLFIYLFKFFKRKNLATRYADKKLYPWIIIPSTKNITGWILNKNTFYITGWIFLSIALAGPRTIINQPGNPGVDSNNIMLVVDESLSMQAMDIHPNRLRRAQIEISEFIEAASKQRIGIIAYAARPHLYVPLTYDHHALRQYLESLDKLTFPTRGSDLVAALLLAEKELSKYKGKSAIILLTDGDTSLVPGNNILSQLDILKRTDIPLYIVGTGTIEGEAIPLQDGSWLNYQNKPVISRLNQSLLQDLAKRYNGAYTQVQDNDSDWQSLYNHGLLHNSVIKTNTKDYTVQWHENYPCFLALALIFFIISLTPLKIVKPGHEVVVTILALSLFALPSNNAHAFNLLATPEQQAYQAYSNKHYNDALQLYKNIKGYRGIIGMASSMYKLGHYKQAIKQFSLAIIYAKTDSQRAAALYNLANSYFHTGNFSAAITTYQDVLRYQPSHQASKANLLLSQQLYKTLLKQFNNQPLTSRPIQGRGPRSTNIDTGTEIKNNTSVSLGESRNQVKNDINLPEYQGATKETFNKLLRLGLEHIQLAQQKNSASSTTETRSDQDIVTAKIYQKQLKEYQPQLWKRLFEMEEGFPAPVKKPRTIPGIMPW